MADWHDIHLESQAVSNDPMSDDDFEALDYDDCVTGSDSEPDEDLGGWVMYGSNSKSQHAEASLSLSKQLISRGAPDVLRKRGILKEREHANANYYVNSCPGTSLSNLKGTAIYCSKSPKMQDKSSCMENQRAKMLRLIMERSFNVLKKRPAKKETYAKNAYIVGSGPGKMLNNSYKDKPNNKLNINSLLHVHKCASPPTVQKRKNYYVNSGPGNQSDGTRTSGTYTIGSCPGRELKKSKPSKNDASDAYRQAYQVFTPSAAKIRALEKGLLKAMQFNGDVQVKRHARRTRIQIQLERARHARARALEVTEKLIKAETIKADREEQLREAFTAIQGNKYSPASIPEPKPMTTEMSPVKVPPTTFYADLEDTRYEPTEVVKRVLSRDDLLRQAFVAEAKVKAAQDTVREFAIGGRIGRIVIGDEKGRDELLRQSFVAEAKVKAAQDTVREFAIGGRIGRTVIGDEKGRDELLRQSFVAEAKVKAAQDTVREFAIGGRRGSGSGIVVGDEKGRDELLRQSFAVQAQIKIFQKKVKDFAIGGRIGSGSGITINDEPNRDELLRESRIGGGTKFAAFTTTTTIFTSEEPTSLPPTGTSCTLYVGNTKEPTLFLGIRKAKIKLRNKLTRKKRCHVIKK